MKKVLILSNSAKGLYNFRYEVIEAIAKEYQVYISLPDEEHSESFKALGCEMIRTSINRRGINPIEDGKLLRAYMRIVKEIKPDVVLTYTIKPNIYGGIACRIKRIPYLVNITGLGSALENPGFLQRITKNLYRIALKKASCIFLQNKENLEFFEANHISKGKKILLPGSGVNLDKYKCLPMKEHGTNFLFISRIMREKGIEEYLEAAKVIKEKYPNTSFAVLGGMEESYEKIIKKMTECNIIEYYGNVWDVTPYLKNAHCLIHPSYYPEGMSNVCLESAASGRAVITTKRAGCKETVEDEVSGYHINEKDVKNLIEKMERFLSLSFEEKQKMGSAGRKKMELEFDRKIVVKQYMEEIQHVVI
ncbi:MAG: glycosyltransferase family 4 protein [Lachnospiraceae bacterium]